MRTNRRFLKLRKIETLLSKLIEKPQKKWYQKIEIKDITIVTGLIAFSFTVFSFRDTYTSFQQKNRMVQSIANTVLLVSQDIMYRGDRDNAKSFVADSLIKTARQLSPQDPDLYAVEIYHRFARNVCHPTAYGLESIDAYLRFYTRLDSIDANTPWYSKLLENKNSLIKKAGGEYNQKLYYSAAGANINLVLSDSTIDSTYKLKLLTRAKSYIKIGIEITTKAKDTLYRPLFFASKIDLILANSELTGSIRDEDVKNFDTAYAVVDESLKKFRLGSREEKLTGYDGAGNINYSMSRFLLLQKDSINAVKYLKISINYYDSLVQLFPDRSNHVAESEIATMKKRLKM